MASGMHLFLRRTFTAQERRLMAWIRTSVSFSLIRLGFSIYKFFDYLAKAEQAPGVVMLHL
jgi:uncharacterized membrane protein YidH (DUF202 family)